MARDRQTAAAAAVRNMCLVSFALTDAALMSHSGVNVCSTRTINLDRAGSQGSGCRWGRRVEGVVRQSACHAFPALILKHEDDPFFPGADAAVDLLLLLVPTHVSSYIRLLLTRANYTGCGNESKRNHMPVSPE